MNRIRAAVIGVGSFGRNHARVMSQLEGVELAAIVDTDWARGQSLGQQYGCPAYSDVGAIIGTVDAAIVASPTETHADLAGRLLEAGIDVLVEKPIASTSASGERLAQFAEKRGRILQVGHLERFNPAVLALEQALTVPLFFEVHRLSMFTPRSLDIDVVLDLMIHDLDLVLNCVKELPVEVHAAGISVLSPKVDIANVRLVFPSGCIANLTASRVSTEQVRKLRLFQPGEYISIDYQRQDALRLAVGRKEESPISFEPLFVQKAEPLRLELESFFHCVRTRSRPRVDGYGATSALRVAESILAKIAKHAEIVADTVRRAGQPSFH
jgi:predicted dehydrogenase